MDQDDAKLIRRAKAGDPRAFSALYHRYYTQVYRYVFFRVNDVPTAEDLTSEVFVRLVENIGGYQDAGRPILAWFYTVARNLLTDHYRREGRAMQEPVDDDLPAEPVDLDHHAQLSFEHRRLAAALQQLTEEQRQVIVLKFFDEIDNATVAKLLNKTVGSVKALQHRALATLARLLVVVDEGVGDRG